MDEEDVRKTVAEGGFVQTKEGTTAIKKEPCETAPFL